MRHHGYSLIELSIVLAVLALLSMAFVPSLVETAKSTVATRAVADVTHILDASVWYYNEDAAAPDASGMKDPRRARWPGQLTETTCAASNVDAFTALSQGYLHFTADFMSGVIPLNPWGHPYVISLVGAPAMDLPYSHCLLRVATDIPIEVAGIYRAALPRVECVPSFNTGHVTCLTTIPKPGVQASISELYFK
jgi:prepilin-type N-terminal cleavage/methylation domain-containing protein